MTGPSGFEEFVRRYQDMVYSTAARLLGRGPDAEDITQEAFLKAFERFDDLKDSPSAGGWLKTVSRNLSLNHLSRHRARWKLFSQLSEEDAAGVGDRTSAPDPVPAEGTQDLQEALLALPDHQRVPLVLFHYEDMSYEKISRRLGVSLAKVKSDILRARRALRTLIGEVS